MNDLELDALKRHRATLTPGVHGDPQPRKQVVLSVRQFDTLIRRLRDAEQLAKIPKRPDCPQGPNCPSRSTCEAGMIRCLRDGPFPWTDEAMVRSIEYTVEGGYVCGKCEGATHDGTSYPQHGPHCPKRPPE